MSYPIDLAGLIPGRIVHLTEGGQCRAAIIRRVWNDQTGCSNLTVFTDGENDGPPDLLISRTSVLHEHWGGGREHNWHWPQDCGERPGAISLAEAGATP